MTQIFINNIKNIWGESGEMWLSQLPDIIDALSKQWSLSDINPVSNMTYNYVALATQAADIPVVLKISCDENVFNDEYKALAHFNGHGSIKCLDKDNAQYALLLEQAVPGNTLKAHMLPIDAYAAVANALATVPLNDHNYTHVSYWCKTIDQITDARIAQKYIDKAQALRSHLLGTAKNEYLCHGDLHLDNIIQQGDHWVSIDPKGIIGEKAFEAAAFDLFSEAEIISNNINTNKIINRTSKLATALNIDHKRLLHWIYLRCIISAQWFIEDKGDPTKPLILLQYIYAAL